MYAPPERPKRGRARRIIVGLLVVVVLLLLARMVISRLAGGGGGSADQVTYSREGDQQLGDLRVAGFNYINACDVYTPEAAGVEFDHDVIATFATKTYGEQDPFRTYQSRCQRETVSVQIDQFSSKAVQAKMGAILPGFEPDEEFQQALGVGAGYNPTLRHLTFALDNKHVFVKHSDSTIAENEARQEILDIAQAVKKRIEQRAQQPSQVLDTSPKKLKVGSFPYHSACELWGPEDYRELLGVEPDEAAIEAEYAQRIPRSESLETSACIIHTRPPKAPEPDSGELAESTVDQIVELRMEQADSVDFARDSFGGDDETPENVKGADDATVSRGEGGMGAVQVLHVLKDNVEFTVRVDRLGTGGSPEDSGDPDQDLDLLKEMARTIVRRMD
jgi:hypothetical protein